MDRIKILRIVSLCVFLYAFVLNTLACKEKILEKKLPLLDSEIKYDYDKMIDAEKDHPTDKTSYDYSLMIIKKEKEFLKKCTRISDNNLLTGDWKLVNAEGNEIKNHSYYFNELISISKYKTDLVLDNWGDRSTLYSGNDNRYYIFSRSLGIIRMIKINGDKLFVYIVQNEEWVLDPIHKEGEYLFQKISKDSNNIINDMNSWFETL